MPPIRKTTEHYKTGIVCALPLELTAVVAMLDTQHETPGIDARDPNQYACGSMSGQDVVIACLPASAYGNVTAANAATHMSRSFPIKYALMVGVGGGVWSKRNDIRLGDVVVSQPTAKNGGLVQWDFGKTEQDGFHRVGSLDKPPTELLRALSFLKMKHDFHGHRIQEHLEAAHRRWPRLATYCFRPTADDNLYDYDYDHPDADDHTCMLCDQSRLVARSARHSDETQIFYGNIASGDQVLKHGRTRDHIAEREGIICFEMEAAGISSAFPCLVVRGICDYADSHKNKQWQPYAAGVAAAYAKELLASLNTPRTVVPAVPSQRFANDELRLDDVLVQSSVVADEEDVHVADGLDMHTSIPGWRRSVGCCKGSAAEPEPAHTSIHDFLITSKTTPVTIPRLSSIPIRGSSFSTPRYISSFGSSFGSRGHSTGTSSTGKTSESVNTPSSPTDSKWPKVDYTPSPNKRRDSHQSPLSPRNSISMAIGSPQPPSSPLASFSPPMQRARGLVRSATMHADAAVRTTPSPAPPTSMRVGRASIASPTLVTTAACREESSSLSYM